MRLAEFDDASAIALIEAQPGAKQKQSEQVINRINQKDTPPGASQPHLAEPIRTEIINRTFTAPADANGWKMFLKAVRTLTKDEVDPDFLLPLLKECWIFSADEPQTRAQCQYTVAHVDVTWHQQTLN